MNSFFIFRIEGGEFWGLTGKTLKEAELRLDKDKRTAGKKRVLHYRVPTPATVAITNISGLAEDEEFGK